MRPLGGDVRAGDRVVQAGTTLCALSHRGARSRRRRLAGLRCATPARRGPRRRAPSCARPASSSATGEIYESNGVMLAAVLPFRGRRGRRAAEPPRTTPRRPPHRARARARGGRPRHLGRRVGRPARSRPPHARGSRCVEEVFWRVAMRPGKPISFAARGRTLVFGLPGNPVSSLVGALLFVAPALARAAGRARPGAAVPTGRPGRVRAAEPGPRRFPAGPPGGPNGRRARAARRAGLAHDRASGGRRRARPRPARRRRARRGLAVRYLPLGAA